MRDRLRAKSVRRAGATALLAAVLWVPTAGAVAPACDEICDIPYPHVVEHCSVDCGWIRCNYDWDVRGFMIQISCDDE